MTNNQLLPIDTTTQLVDYTQPSSKTIPIQVRFWRTPGLPFPYHKGSSLGSFPQGKEGHDDKCHFLGAYEGPMPSAVQAKTMVKDMEGKSPEERKNILASLDILYGFFPQGNDEGHILPILKGSTLSFFSSWEDHQFIEGMMNKLGINAITFRVEVPQVCRVFTGNTREEDSRPLFSGTFYGIKFTNIEEGSMAEWKSSSTYSFPIFIPKSTLDLPELKYQQQCLDCQNKMAAKAGYRNQQLLGKSPLPFYLRRTTIGGVSPLLDTSSMSLYEAPSNPSLK